MAQTTTKVNRNERGQYQVTVPKAIGDAFDLGGKRLEWSIGSASNKLEVTIVDE